LAKGSTLKNRGVRSAAEPAQAAVEAALAQHTALRGEKPAATMMARVWIPEVTRHGLVIITRDKHIERRTWEKDQVLACRARMFAITSEENLNTWGLAEVVITQVRKIEAAAEEPGPYIYSLTRTSLHKIDLY
jgi:PIN like domain